MYKKWPYDDVARDVRRHEVESPETPQDIDEFIRDRETGINGESNEGFRDGVTKVKRMYPEHYIPNPRSGR